MRYESGRHGVARSIYAEQMESKKAKIAEQQQKFRTMAQFLAWTPNTIYPRDEFQRGDPRGQCGITNFGFGVWLVWLGLIKPSQYFYVEGQAHEADGDLIDDKHAWGIFKVTRKLLSTTLEYADLTLDQYAGVGQGVVAGSLGKPRDRSILSSYVVQVKDEDRPPGLVSVRYVPETITPLGEYDTAPFGQRLDKFLGTCLHKATMALTIGPQAIKGTIDDLWLPHNSAYSMEDRRALIAARYCDGQTWV